MTTSYIKDKIKDLQAQKKIDRANEEAERLAKEKLLAERKKLSDERIAQKQMAIDVGEVFVNVEPVVVKEIVAEKITEEVKPVVKKAVKKSKPVAKKTVKAVKKVTKITKSKKSK
jgi:hypothetical protein